VAGGLYAHSDGDVWGVAGPGAKSVLADGFVSSCVCIGDCGVGRVWIAGNRRRAGEHGKCESAPWTADCGQLFGAFGNAAGNCAGRLHVDCAVARESGGEHLEKKRRKTAG